MVPGGRDEPVPAWASGARNRGAAVGRRQRGRADIAGAPRGGAGPDARGRTVKRTIGMLAVCQALMMTSQALVVTTSALVGFALAPVHSLATLRTRSSSSRS